MRTQIPLTAGVPQTQWFNGRGIAIMGITGASDVGLTLLKASQTDTEAYGKVGKNFSLFFPDSGFVGAEFTASADCVVDVIVSQARVETLDGQNLTVSINPASEPVPVATTRGDGAGNPLYVSGTVLGDTPAASGVDNAGVAAGPAAADLMAADATRLEAVIYNQGPDPVAIGMAGITWAKRSIVLDVGDVWIESRLAAMHWQAITDAGKAATVTVQERKS